METSARKRAFIAVDVPDEVSLKVVKRMDELTSGAIHFGTEMHITILFLGDISSEKASRVSYLLSKLQASQFPVSFSGVGEFRNNGRIVLFAKISDGADRIDALRAAIIPGIIAAGIKIEGREYVPHMTLCRIKEGTDAAEAAAMVAARSSTECIGSFVCRQVKLKHSSAINGRFVHDDIFVKELIP
jgi:2'-5' RNA ligase